MENKTLSYYNKNAGRWAAMKNNSFYHEEPFRIFEKLLSKGSHVIDIGCAYGIHVPLFLGIGRKLRYEGIDISSSMIKLARSRYPQIRFSIADILRYKPKRKFDAFWAAAVLMHIPMDDWPRLLDRMESITKPNAVGYITLPSVRPNMKSTDDPRHFELFDKAKFRSIAKARKWKILKSGTHSGTNMTPWHWFVVKLP